MFYNNSARREEILTALYQGTISVLCKYNTKNGVLLYGRPKFYLRRTQSPCPQANGPALRATRASLPPGTEVPSFPRPPRQSESRTSTERVSSVPTSRRRSGTGKRPNVLPVRRPIATGAPRKHKESDGRFNRESPCSMQDSLPTRDRPNPHPKG